MKENKSNYQGRRTRFHTDTNNQKVEGQNLEGIMKPKSRTRTEKRNQGNEPRTHTDTKSQKVEGLEKIETITQLKYQMSRRDSEQLHGMIKISD